MEAVIILLIILWVCLKGFDLPLGTLDRLRQWIVELPETSIYLFALCPWIHSGNMCPFKFTSYKATFNAYSR